MTPPETTTATSLPTRRRLWIFRVLLLALVLCVLQGAAYVYLRLARGYDGTHLMQYEYDPYKNVLPTRNYVDTRGVRHNSVGFRRSSEVTRAKPSGTIRIFLMGGSTAYGLGGLWPHLEAGYPVLRNEETIDAYLQSRLSAAFPGTRIEVINAAITSTWTHHSLIYLEQSVLGYDPDMILFLDGFNDFYHSNPNHDQFSSYPYVRSSMIIEGEPTLGALATMNGWWAFRKIALIHVLGRAGRQLKLLVTPREEAPPLDVARELGNLQMVFPRNAGRMHQHLALLLRHHGIAAVFMLQPLLILERGRPGATDLERKLLEFNVASYRPNHEAFVQQATPWIAGQERAMAAALGASFLDLTGAFKAIRGQVYTDYCHLTPLGNQVLADVIAAHVTPLLRTRLGSQSARATSAHR